MVIVVVVVLVIVIVIGRGVAIGIVLGIRITINEQSTVLALGFRAQEGHFEGVWYVKELFETE